MLVHTLTTVNEHILKYLNGYDLASLSCTETECKKCVYAHDTHWRTHEAAEPTKHSWRKQFYTICHASRVFSGRMYPNFCIQHANVVYTAMHKQLLFIVIGNGMIYVYDERAKELTLQTHTHSSVKCATSVEGDLFVSTMVHGLVYIDLNRVPIAPRKCEIPWNPVHMHMTQRGTVCIALENGNFGVVRYQSIGEANEIFHGELHHQELLGGFVTRVLCMIGTNKCIVAMRDYYMTKMDISTHNADVTLTRYNHAHDDGPTVKEMKQIGTTNEAAILFINFDICIMKESMAIRKIGCIPFVGNYPVTMVSYMHNIMVFSTFIQHVLDTQSRKLTQTAASQMHEVTTCAFEENKCVVGCSSGAIFIVPL